MLLFVLEKHQVNHLIYSLIASTGPLIIFEHLQACVEFNRGRYSDSLELYKVCDIALLFVNRKQHFIYVNALHMYLLLSVYYLASTFL